MIFRNASQYIESLGKQFRAVAPLSHQHLIKTPDPSCQHQGVAGETEPVGFGVGDFGGRGERRERIAPRAARVTSVSPLHRERRDRRLRQRTRTKVVTGNRAFAPGKDDPGEGGEEAEDGFKDVHDL